MTQMEKTRAYYHLPGLYEFYELYRAFLPLWKNHREYFYDWCEIGSIYGAPCDCIWAGGRISDAQVSTQKVLDLAREYGFSPRLTFSNSLLENQHLSDEKCNELCRQFAQATDVASGVIVHSDVLVDYLTRHYPSLYLVSSTTKVITDFIKLLEEIQRKEFAYVVPDFRLNKQFSLLEKLTSAQKVKVEFLCNECCWVGCQDRKKCYETVSRQVLDESYPDHICQAPFGQEGYRFSRAMNSPSFISVDDIQNKYLPMGFTNFKIEGRGLGSAIVLEFLLYYMVKPEYQIYIREEIYLDNTLDLF